MFASHVRLGFFCLLLPISAIGGDLKNLVPRDAASSGQTYAVPTKSATSDIRKDIKELENLQLVKGELETSSEYVVRIKKLYQKYDGRIYTISLAVKEQNKNDRKMVSFDPDSETLRVVMPGLNFTSVGINANKETQTYRLTSSFLELETLGLKQSSYVGRNGFGREATVSKLEGSFVGLALLGSSDQDMTPQTFSTTISRDRVRDIFEKGRVVLTVKTELLKDGEDSFLMETWLFPKKASLLIVDKNERTPTMNRPVHVLRTSYALPVRILSVKLLDGTNQEVFQALGSEINTVAMEKS